jgi:RimJ/RimL family protein N-acetyltransferase
MSTPWVSATTLLDPTLAPTIRLEPLTTAHAAHLFAVATPELFHHTAQSPQEWSEAGFAAEIEKVCAIPDSVPLAILLNETGRAIGRTTFMEIKPEHRGLEIGRTWMGRDFQGTRVNPEAKYLMLRHAFEQLQPTAIRVQITTNITNLHSQAAIAKLGAVREGVIRKSRIIPPGPGRPEAVARDWVVFSILDDEWPQVKAGLEARLTALPISTVQ